MTMDGNSIALAGAVMIGMKDTTIHKDGSVDVGASLVWSGERDGDAIILRSDTGIVWVVSAQLVNSLLYPTQPVTLLHDEIMRPVPPVPFNVKTETWGKPS